MGQLEKYTKLKNSSLPAPYPKVKNVAIREFILSVHNDRICSIRLLTYIKIRTRQTTKAKENITTPC